MSGLDPGIHDGLQRLRHAMRLSTKIIIIIGLVPIFFELALLLLPDPSRDVGIPWAIMVIEAGLAIVGVGLMKWLILDWLLGFEF
jgi:hypothetical protein